MPAVDIIEPKIFFYSNTLGSKETNCCLTLTRKDKTSKATRTSEVQNAFTTESFKNLPNTGHKDNMAEPKAGKYPSSASHSSPFKC